MRNSTWKKIGVAAPVVGALAAFGVLAAQAVSGGSADTTLPVPSGMTVAVARGTETVTTPSASKGSLAVDMNNWQETARRGSPRRI